jgi:branched-chain amino acid transport system substrate-binding protein
MASTGQADRPPRNGGGDRTIARLALVLATLAVGACRPAPSESLRRGDVPAPAPSASPAASVGAPIRIGLLLNLELDRIAESRDVWDGAALALEHVNGGGGVRVGGGSTRQLELSVYDDDGRPDRAGPIVRGLSAEDRAVAAIGPAMRTTARAAAVAAEANELPLISLAEIEDDRSRRAPGRWAFSIVPSDEDALAVLVDFLAGRGNSRLAWIAPRTATGERARETLARLAAGRGVSIVAEDSYPLEDDRFGERLARLNASGAQQIVGWPAGTSDATELARAGAETATLARLNLGPGASERDFPRQAGDAASGLRAPVSRLLVSNDLWDHDPLTPTVRDFARAFRLRYSREPTPRAAGGWDAARVIVEGIGRSGLGRQGLRAAIEETVGTVGATGFISFGPQNHDGLDERSLIVARASPTGWRLPP